MNHRSKTVQRRTAIPAYREAFERLDAALVRANQRDQRDAALMEDYKMTRARIALFGCAPK